MSNVLKAGSRGASSGVPLNFIDLEAEAARLIARARAAASSLVAEAKTACEEVRRAAREEGLAAGREEGLAQGRAEGAKAAREEETARAREDTAHLASALKKVAGEIETRRERLVKQAEGDLLDLALAIARRVVRCELEAASGRVAAAQVREAVRLAADRARLELHVHPADLEAAKAVHPELVRAYGEDFAVRFVADESVGRGGARLVSATGEVDLAIGTQLDRVESALLGTGRGDEEPDAEAEASAPGEGDA